MVAVDLFAARDARAEWERCKGYLQPALDYAGNTHTLADIAAGVASGRYHFWPGEKSAAITEVWEYPRARHLIVFLAGGDLHELVAMVPSFMSWGKHLGCTKIVECGRPGWERVLGNQGWKREAVVLSRPIE